MAKKRKDGLMQRKFRIEGKQYVVYGHTAKELNEKEQQKREQIANGVEIHDHPTLNQYYEMWTDARRDSIKESTLHKQDCQYRGCASVVIPSLGVTLGEIKLEKITPDDIREVQKNLKETRKTQTVNDSIAVLSHIFNTAIKERRLSFNPCICVMPLKRVEEQARDTHHRALTPEETEAFFKEAERRNSFYLNVYRFAINTGMRCGEIGALLPSDVKNGMIHVQRTITRKEAGNYVIGDTAKTSSGRRSIPVNDEIEKILQEQKRLNTILDGNITKIGDPIFKAPERGLLMSTPINREIGRICKVTGIEKFTMHAFRATFATRMIENGVDVRTIQELLGHADYALTMNLYGHVLDKTKTEAMKKAVSVLKAI